MASGCHARCPAEPQPAALVAASGGNSAATVGLRPSITIHCVTVVAYFVLSCYNCGMETALRWVLLAYRLPREPSTPRIALWRKLRQLGGAQLLDNLVALPLTSQTREQLDWLAESVVEAGGDASVWLAEPGARGEGRSLVEQLQAARAAEYRAVAEEAISASATAGPGRARTLARLRRELRRIRARDYFNSPERAPAEAAVEGLAAAMEVME
jgi:hypothetical protein